MIIDEDLYLEHFGVKGMRWGIRNDRQRAQARNARRAANAQKYLNKAALLQTRINTLEKVPVNPYSLRGQRVATDLNELREKRNVAISDAQRKSEGKLSKGQRKALTAAGVIGGVLAAYGTYTMVQSGEARRLITKGKDFMSNKHDPGWKLDRSLADKKSTDAIMRDVVSKINPGYGDTGTKVNCRRATMAYEMRRRGYDVAATKTTDGRGQTFVGMFNAFSKDKDIVPSTEGGIKRKLFTEKFDFGRGKIKDQPFQKLVTDTAKSTHKAIGQKRVSPAKIFSELNKLPDGARGELGMQWLPGGGHSMAWEIVNGKAVIFDTQSGQVYKSAAQFGDIAANMADSAYTRLDNVPLNTNFLMRWVKNA